MNASVIEADRNHSVDFNRFDISAKELVWEDPAGWLEGFGIGPVGPVEVIDSDITALTAAADKVLRVGGDSPFLVNIELQANHQTDLVRTLWFRQVALDYRHGCPVLTVLVLLRKEANSPSLTGTFERQLPNGRLTNRYDYQVVRLWQERTEPFLTGSIGLVPLAPLANVEPPALPVLVRRMAQRINHEPQSRAAKLWTATFLLMGLRFPDELTAELLEGVMSLRESTTFQAILREGRNEGRIEGRIAEAQRFLLRLGTRRFGEPDAATVAALEAIQDIDRLEALGERILDQDIQNWSDLLGRS